MKEYKNSVRVVDGNVEKALRKFKKRIQESGLLDDLRAREFYEKGAAQARLRKKLREQALPKKLY